MKQEQQQPHDSQCLIDLDTEDVTKLVLVFMDRDGYVNKFSRPYNLTIQLLVRPLPTTMSLSDIENMIIDQTQLPKPQSLSLTTQEVLQDPKAIIGILTDVVFIHHDDLWRWSSWVKHFHSNTQHYRINRSIVIDYPVQLQDVREQSLMNLNLRVGNWYNPNTLELLIQDNTSENIYPNLKVVCFDIEMFVESDDFPSIGNHPIKAVGVQRFNFNQSPNQDRVNNDQITFIIHEPDQSIRQHQLQGVDFVDTELELIIKLNQLLDEAHIIVTYNGTDFDIQHITRRSEFVGIEPKYKSTIHHDVFKWVCRDLGLPQGLRSLKNVASQKLKGVIPWSCDHIELPFIYKHNISKFIDYLHSDILYTSLLWYNYIKDYSFQLTKSLPLTLTLAINYLSGQVAKLAIHQRLMTLKLTLLYPSTHTFNLGSNVTVQGAITEANWKGVVFSNSDLHQFQQCQTECQPFQFMDQWFHTTLPQSVSLFKLYKESCLNNQPQPVTISHFDVVSMYPNIILQCKLQPHTAYQSNSKDKHSLSCENCPLKNQHYPKCAMVKAVNLDLIDQPNNQKVKQTKSFEVSSCLKRNSFFVELLSELLQLRMSYKSQMKTLQPQDTQYKVLDGKQQSCKLIINSFYGIMSQPSSPFFSPLAGGMVTSMGQEIITLVRDFLTQTGHQVLQIDTDGCWVLSRTKPLITQHLRQIINSYISSELGRKYDSIKLNKCLIEFEGNLNYRAFLNPTNKKDRNKPSKKKYITISESGESSIKGLEIIKEKTNGFVRSTQTKIINLLKISKTKSEFESRLRDCVSYTNIMVDEGIDRYFTQLQLLKLLSNKTGGVGTIRCLGGKKGQNVKTDQLRLQLYRHNYYGGPKPQFPTFDLNYYLETIQSCLDQYHTVPTMSETYNTNMRVWYGKGQVRQDLNQDQIRMNSLLDCVD